MWVHFFNFDHLRITLQSSDIFWGTKFCAPSLLLPPLIFSYLQTLIYGFLWWWTSSWLIVYLKWRLQSSFFLLHSVAIELQEAKDSISIDEEDPRPTSSTWSYIRLTWWHDTPSIDSKMKLKIFSGRYLTKNEFLGSSLKTIYFLGMKRLFNIWLM